MSKGMGIPEGAPWGQVYQEVGWGEVGMYTHPARHETWDTHPPPPVLTPSGSYNNTYGWQAAGTHPT